MSTQAPKRKQHSLEVVRKALVAEAVTGSSVRASELVQVPAKTIRDWKLYQHPELYRQIREEVLPQVSKQLAHEANDAIRLHIDIARQTAERIRAKLEAGEDISATDLSTIGRNSGVTGSVLNDKIVGPNTNRPTAIVEHRSTEAFVRQHKQFVVDGTAEEVSQEPEYLPYPRPTTHQLPAESSHANAQEQLEAGEAEPS